MNIQQFKQNLLNKLYEPYQYCTQCPLGSLGRAHVVFGEGNPDADLMIIGEAPGREEDTHGQPFIGRAGKLLITTLQELNVARAACYITNIVKCRPPNNRRPETIESNTCKNLLLFNQIKIIAPKIIITLGGTALTALLQKAPKISNARGKMYLLNTIMVMPTFHPAYILRHSTLFSLFKEDIKVAIQNI